MFDRRGLALGEMNDKAGAAARALLALGLSPEGYRTATAIIGLEQILGEWERRTGNTRLRRDPALYFFSVFGDPSTRSPWAWRVEGHHLSLHFTVTGSGGITASPFFFGANPAEVRHGPHTGQRTLAAEEELARQLLTSLDGDLRTRAVINAVAPDDILTRAAPRVDLRQAEGLAAESMAAAQRERLVGLIRVYAERLPPALAEGEMRRLRSGGLNQVHFAWAGSAEPGKPHYYRIQGLLGLVEYDNTQDDANHIHTVWRRPEADFGRDLLKRHYRSGHSGP
jgi:hypothetical protein